MQAYIEPAAIEVEAYRFHEGLAQPMLDINRKWTAKRLNGRQSLLSISRPLDEIRNAAAKATGVAFGPTHFPA